MKRCLLVLTLPAILAAAPSPLIVGSVRDQYGAPVAGARVTGGTASARTDAQGTFALSVRDVRSVTITCAYCVPLTVGIAGGEPVVAFVHRSDAVAQDSPSDRDIAAVPYTHAESVAALRPFTVLERSSHPLPGPQISDRGMSPRGALVVDDGIPAYDIASNQSPFAAFPAYAVQHISWLPPGGAFSYGDLAGGGIMLADTHSQDAYDRVVSAGGTNAAALAQSFGPGAAAAAFSHDPQDTRVRFDGTARIPSSGGSFDLTAAASQDRYAPGAEYLNTSLNGIRLNYERVEQNRVDASVTADGGGYDGATPGTAYSARWSDVQAQAGVTTGSRVQFFASAGARASTGRYWSSNANVPGAGAAITQSRVTAGLQTSGERYSLRLGAGAFGFHYSGGARGPRSALDGGLVVPGFSGSFAFDPHWALDVQAGGSFALPTVLEAFVYPPDTPQLVLDRNVFAGETLSYGDLRRLRAAATVMSERVNGLDNGTIHSAGLSVAWQVAPDLSLRAWLLHEDDQTQPYEPVYRFGSAARPATVGSYWATYETPGIRIDAIYRRDLLDYRLDPHLDASISTPIARGLRLFGATERRAGTRYVTAGLRIESP